jgi:anti-sigma regulatory factor (Ser/Thr protein kinase)
MGWLHLLAPAGGTFTDNDEALLGQLAQVGAVALENTREYEREHHIAETLQRSLLPMHIASPAGTEIATRYFPGAGGARVGGDWYDVIPLPEGMVAVVLGDVVGHGIRAAATMGQLRAALRAYAVVDPTPASVLRRLEQLIAVVGDASEGYVATLAYAVVDPFRGQLHYLSSGHPAPMMLLPDGTATFLEDALGLPLGIGDPTDVVHGTVAMPEGATLLMYSDGLIERRGESLDAGLRRLLDACCTDGSVARASVDGLCDHVVGQMSESGESDDDVAVLAVRMTGRALEHMWELPVVTSSVPIGRALIVDALHEGGRHQLAEAAALVTSELLTNAVKKARVLVRLVVRILPGGEVHLAVHDDNPEAPDVDALAPPPADAEGGRGLLIVQSVASRWGITPEDDGKTVWCVLPDVDPLSP